MTDHIVAEAPAAAGRETLQFRAGELRDRVTRQRELTVFLATLLLFTVLSLTVPQFCTASNLIELVRQIAVTAIIAVGMTFLIISGEFDISVGSVVGFTGVVMAVLISQYGFNAWLALLLTLGLGAMIGLGNAFFVTYIGLPSFLVTLAGLSLWRGGAVVVSGGWPISAREAYAPTSLIYGLTGADLFGIPVHVIWLALIAVVGGWVLANTRFGAHVYATGGNAQAALVMGVNTRRVKTVCFVMTSVLAAFAGALLLGFLKSAQPLAAASLELEVIAAVIIGGTAMYGGAGRVVGTLIGAFLIGMIRNGIILAGASAYWQEVAVGAVILLAVSTDVIMRRRSQQRIRRA
jgi:ribose/xylose/arabinose/galactoside ABC-type transport system permease subunit